MARVTDMYGLSYARTIFGNTGRAWSVALVGELELEWKDIERVNFHSIFFSHVFKICTMYLY